MSATLCRTAFLVFLTCAVSFSLQAQSDSPAAHLSGTLLDSSGAGVPGVRITARLENAPNAAPLAAISANDGSYSLTFPAGRYRIQFARESFVPRDFVLDFFAGQSRMLDLHLELERLSSSVV